MKNNKFVIIKNELYYKSHITDGVNHYVREISNARVFKSLEDILNVVNKYKIKNYDIGILYWKDVVEWE